MRALNALQDHADFDALFEYSDSVAEKQIARLNKVRKERDNDKLLVARAELVKALETGKKHDTASHGSSKMRNDPRRICTGQGRSVQTAWRGALRVHPASCACLKKQEIPMEQTIRFLLSRDDWYHQRGYWVLASALRNAGTEVVLGGIQTPKDLC